MSTIENFTFKVPNSITNRPNLRPLFASALLACLLTYPILGINQNGIFASILLFIIFFITIFIISNITKNGIRWYIIKFICKW